MYVRCVVRYNAIADRTLVVACTAVVRRTRGDVNGFFFFVFSIRHAIRINLPLSPGTADGFAGLVSESRATIRRDNNIRHVLGPVYPLRRRTRGLSGDTRRWRNNN